MTDAARKILEEFDDLDEGERQEVGAAILQRVDTWTTEPLSDSELILATESIFLDLDAQERRG